MQLKATFDVIIENDEIEALRAIDWSIDDPKTWPAMSGEMHFKLEQAGILMTQSDGCEGDITSLTQIGKIIVDEINKRFISLP